VLVAVVPAAMVLSAVLVVRAPLAVGVPRRFARLLPGGPAGARRRSPDVLARSAPHALDDARAEQARGSMLDVCTSPSSPR